MMSIRPPLAPKPSMRPPKPKVYQRKTKSAAPMMVNYPTVRAKIGKSS